MANLSISISASTVQSVIAMFVTHPFTSEILAAPARAAAAHALVTTAVSHHNRAADVASGRVSQVDHSGEGVSGMDGTRRRSPPFVRGKLRTVVGRWQTRIGIDGRDRPSHTCIFA